MKKITLFVLIMLGGALCYGQQKHVFSLSKSDFLLDGKPFQIISGELHPARIPAEYWRQRIRMTKAMGCNTIAAYVFWNYHESKPGVFDFKTGNHDIAKFIRICKEEGMWVMVRPGPYVCAEWDFGGLPAWLLKIPDIKVRCMDPRYIKAMTSYVNHLSAEIKPLQCGNGGPVVMLQVENEYGSYGNDRAYLQTLRKLWLQNGINVPFYTADGAAQSMLDAGHLAGTALGLDPGVNDGDFEQAKIADPNTPAFSSETYPGWLTHWKEAWANVDTISLKKDITYLLDHHRSFNLYVAHGGTNFGFTAGANAFSATQYQPTVTSYDYDSPINELGQPTPKYFMLRNLIARYVKYKIPAVPASPGVINIPAISLKAFTSVWQQLPKPFLSAQPVPMEYYNQNQGLMLYRTKLIGHKKGRLTITEPHDYALVFLNGKFIDTIYRDGGKWTVELPASNVKDPVLDILVEGMGHINFAEYMIDRKGITDRVTLNGMTLMNWQQYPLSLSEDFIKQLKPIQPAAESKGVFFKGGFTLAKTGDTYFDLSKYGKGVVYVNGHNLGRYWNVGPQRRLYCPASWLIKGTNEIIVLDLHGNQPQQIIGETSLKAG